MSEQMEQFDTNVSNTDSVLLQCASENVVSTENFTNNVLTLEKDHFQTDLNDNLASNGNFDFDDNSYPSGATVLNTQNTQNYPPNLEQLIQESVSRSTARLLTKNALKYLDKDLMVNSGDGVSHQFTVRAPYKKETSKNTYRKSEPYSLSASTRGKGFFESPGPVQVDPKLSSFKLHKVTYEMYKLFDNMKSFDLKESKFKIVPNVYTVRDTMRDVVPKDVLQDQFVKDVNSQVHVQPDVNVNVVDATATVVPSFQQVVKDDKFFESRMRPGPYPSLSTACPEDSNLTVSCARSLQLNTSGMFENNNFNNDNFTLKSSHNFEVNYDKNNLRINSQDLFVQKQLDTNNFFEEFNNTKQYVDEDNNGLLNYQGLTVDKSDFNDTDNLDKLGVNNDSGYPPFELDQESFTPNETDYENQPVGYGCFNKCTNYNTTVSVDSVNDANKDNNLVIQTANSNNKVNNDKVGKFEVSGQDKSDNKDDKNFKNIDSNKQKNRQNFNPGFTTRVYAPFDRTHFVPKKRAVVVGCNYLGHPDAQLRGSCNDAFAFAQVLVTKFNFDPKNVILLLDASPSPAYTRNLSQFSTSYDTQFNSNPDNGMGFNLDFSKLRNNVIERNTYPTKKTSFFGRHLVERNLKHLTLNENLCLDSTVVQAPVQMHPTRGNLFRSLKWLNFTSCPNDFAVFYFSGHSVQVDDLSGYEGDGFDEALVPLDFEFNGLVTCHDLKCLFQSLGSTCRLNVFLDTCNMQTVVGGSSRLGPVKGSKMKGLWPFSEPTGKLDTFQCNESVYKDSKMINQMTKVKFLPTLQVESLSSLSDVQLSLDSTHGVVNYLVVSSSNLKGVSVECLFKPLNIDNPDFNTNSNNNNNQNKNNANYGNFTTGGRGNNSYMVRDDEVVVHGAFTYTLLLTLLFDKPRRRGGFGVDEVVEGVNKKLSQLKRLRLPKLNQECEVLFYHSSKLPKNAFVFPPFFNSFGTHKYAKTPFGYLLPNDAWMFMVEHGRQKAKEQQQKFERMKTDLITLANLNNKMFNPNTRRTQLNTSRIKHEVESSSSHINEPVTCQFTARVNMNGTNQMDQNMNQVTSGTNLVEVTVKPVAMNPNTFQQQHTTRSMTNNISARVFTRNSSITGRMTARSKSVMLNNMSVSTSGESMKHFGDKYGKLNNQVVESHNWYGGCTVSVPFNKTIDMNNYNYFNQQNYYPTYYNNQVGQQSWMDQPYWKDPFNYGKLETIQMYEPITAALLQKLPTTNSFTVLPQ